MKAILPILGLIIGSSAGIGAGLYLAPADPPSPEPAAAENQVPGLISADEEPSALEMVSLENQFVIPVVDGDRVSAMVVMSISLEVAPGTPQVIFSREAKLRDIFLQVLFEHANMGGFDGAFTNGRNLALMRKTLLEAAQQEFGSDVASVLITDLARRDV